MTTGRRTERRDNVTGRPDGTAEAPTTRLRFGLLAKIILFLAAVLIPLAAITWTISVRTLHQTMTEEFTSKGSAIANSLASSNVDLILTRDASTVQALVDQFGAINGVAYVMVYDREKTLIAHTFFPRVPSGIIEKNLVDGAVAQQVREIQYPDPVTGTEKQILDVAVPMLGGQLGTVRVGMNKATISATTTRAGQFLLLSFAGVAVVAVLAAVFFARRLIKPVARLAKVARRVGRGDLSELVEVTSRDEIGVMAKTFNQAVVRLRSLVQTEAERDEFENLSKHMEQLHRLSTVMQEPLSLTEQFTRVLDAARQVVRLDRLYIWTLTSEADGLAITAQAGFTESDWRALDGLTIPVHEAGAMATVCSKGVSLLFTEQNPLPPEYRLRPPYSAFAGLRVKSFLVIPMIARGRTVGVLAADNATSRAPIPSRTLDLLQTFASQAAVAFENARLFQELQEKSRELEVASRHKSEFLANMSHELRTPLNAIMGYSEMLQEEAHDLGAEGFVSDLKKINAAGKHLLELINAVLDLSKIEAGKMELYLETFAVQALIQDIAAMIKPLAQTKSNRLEVKCDANTGTMYADLTKVRQALFNLLSNACKFTDHGTVSLAVARETAEDVDWITFRVSDTGIGLTPEQMTRLFQEFSQAGAETARKYGGTGLGLALSRRLCRMMGGDITVASEPGRGATFTIQLPAEVARLREEDRTAAPLQAAPAGASTVLVIDDEGATRDLMQRYLTKEGFRVVTAAGGDEGLRLARELRPAAITLDVMMPGLDGWAVLSALKADPNLADIPVIMLTILDDKNLGYALGATDYLTKPIDRERLTAVLNRYRLDRPILVVDDDPTFRELLRGLLEREGYAVIEAENGHVALDLLREAVPGLILLDLMMPEMNGLDFVSAVRMQQVWRTIPIVVVTAKDLSPEDRQRLHGYVEIVLQKGANSRDSLLAEVRETVAACVARRRGAS